MEIDMEIDGSFPSNTSLSSPSKKLKSNQDAAAKVFDSTMVVEGSVSGSLKSDNANNSTSDLSFGNDDNTGDDEELDEDYDEDYDVSDYDEMDNSMFYDKDADADEDEDDYLKMMQAQFDNVDLPPGVEASVSWLNDTTPSAKHPSSTSSSISNDGKGKKEVGTSSSAKAELVETDEEILKKFQAFKTFDTVDDSSDHHFNKMGFSQQQPPKSWAKKVQEEWKILEKGLPDTIFVRVYETRMDLLRAVIIGPSGTPYHDGLFVFDVLFPTNYPDVPPMVYYHSGGLRINPNLYECGKVCLSLLNTWTGNTNERWMPKKSTMLQVLVSIQALILNVDPFFNEPGYNSSYPGVAGRKRSKAYNENVFILSLKTMTYTLRRPPKYFEDLVSSHFRLHSYYILSSCKAYLEGAEIGSLIDDNPEEAAKRNIDNHPGEFKGSVSKLMNSLATSFAQNGSPNCDQFRIRV